MLLEIKEKGTIDSECAKELIVNLSNINKRIEAENKEVKFIENDTKNTALSSQENIGWIINYIPKPDTLKRGNHPENIFSELKELGKLEIICDYSRSPEFFQFNPTECYLSWKLKLFGDIKQHTVQEILMWGTEESEIKIDPMEHKILERRAEGRVKLSFPITSIRVPTEKIDTIMNTVEELVITESVLKQITQELDAKTLRKFSDNLDDLEQHSRRLQEVILRMRMVPISFAINRFPGMVLELAKNLGKKIEFKISGEETEIDKTMVEKITDPLMHLIRNAIDHGIESPEDREKKGKKISGTIELVAYQSGNNIIVDIKDDGAGLNSKKIMESAISKGIVSEDKTLKEEECFQLIFQPGFSTAEKVTDISGRGVGLDVVMKNIHELGGKVEVISTENVGATFRLRLPLTLAIMDCQIFKVGDAFYAIPLSMIIEMRQLDKRQIIQKEDGGEFYALRDELFKLIHLDKLLSIKNETAKTEKFLITIKAEEEVFCLSCDSLLFQQQVVIKSIEENYTKVPGILGATVLGDGELALILDVKEVVKLTSNYISIASKIVEPPSISPKEPKEKFEKTGPIQENTDYLCFLVENKEYAFSMQDIQEVCVWQKHATLPFSPHFIIGVMNLRGKIVPIIDLRILFDLNFCKYDAKNVIIIVNAKNKDSLMFFGVVVDSVTGTDTISYRDVEVDAEIRDIKLMSYIKGVANVKGKTITLLKTDHLVAFPEQKWGVA